MALISKLGRVPAGKKSFFALDAAENTAFDIGQGYGGFGGYIADSENGAHILGDTSKPVDMVESLTVRGLKHLVESSERSTFATDKVAEARQKPLFGQDMSDTARLDPIFPPLRASLVKINHALLPLRKHIGISQNWC